MFYFIYFTCFFPQNDSNVVQGVDEFDTLCGETQLADEVWFHVFYMHPSSGCSPEYPALTSQICLITNDARRCHGFSFADVGMTEHAELIIWHLQNP